MLQTPVSRRVCRNMNKFFPKSPDSLLKAILRKVLPHLCKLPLPPAIFFFLPLLFSGLETHKQETTGTDPQGSWLSRFMPSCWALTFGGALGKKTFRDGRGWGETRMREELGRINRMGCLRNQMLLGVPAREGKAGKVNNAESSRGRGRGEVGGGTASHGAPIACSPPAEI